MTDVFKDWHRSTMAHARFRRGKIDIFHGDEDVGRAFPDGVISVPHISSLVGRAQDRRWMDGRWPSAQWTDGPNGKLINIAHNWPLPCYA